MERSEIGVGETFVELEDFCIRVGVRLIFEGIASTYDRVIYTLYSLGNLMRAETYPFLEIGRSVLPCKSSHMGRSMRRTVGRVGMYPGM